MWADMVAHFTELQEHIDMSHDYIREAHEQLPQNMFEKKP